MKTFFDNNCAWNLGIYMLYDKNQPVMCKIPLYSVMNGTYLNEPSGRTFCNFKKHYLQERHIFEDTWQSGTCIIYKWVVQGVFDKCIVHMVYYYHWAW